MDYEIVNPGTDVAASTFGLNIGCAGAGNGCAGVGNGCSSGDTNCCFKPTPNPDKNKNPGCGSNPKPGDRLCGASSQNC